MKRETGANPVRYLSLYTSCAELQKAKAGHWETEKALQYGSDQSRSGVSQKTCFDVLKDSFADSGNL